MVTISSPLSETDFETYYTLRWKILRQPWGQPPGSEKDKLDTRSMHFMASLNGCIVAIARLHIEDTAAIIRYMGVDIPYQRQGIGSQLLTHLEKVAVNINVTALRLNAREKYIKFYLQNGYIDSGAGHTLYHTIHHRKMIKHLSSDLPLKRSGAR